MNAFREVKKRLIEEDRVGEVLEKLGCEYVKMEQRGKLITAQLPPKYESNNKRLVQVYNLDGLPSIIYKYGIKGDIFTIASFILYDCNNSDDAQEKVGKALWWICNELGYEIDGKKRKRKEDPLAWIKQVKRKRRKKFNPEEVEENKVLDESILNQYLMKPYKPWLNEGISLRAQREFQVGFDLESARVVFPVRNSIGQLISVKGRTVLKDEDKKYIYLYEMNKGIELFNLDKALPYIYEKGEVIVFEGAKSVMKAWSYGYKNCVSIEGSFISPGQEYLLRSLGIGVKIILCFDKDMEEENIMAEAKKIKNREVYVMIDKDDLLVGKDSPVDKGKEIWKRLLNQFLYQVY